MYENSATMSFEVFKKKDWNVMQAFHIMFRDWTIFLRAHVVHFEKNMILCQLLFETQTRKCSTAWQAPD